MDHVIYRDYIVNLRFFIYCSLATPSVDSFLHSTAANRKRWRKKKADFYCDEMKARNRGNVM